MASFRDPGHLLVDHQDAKCRRAAMTGQELAERRAMQRGRCILMCILIALVLHIWVSAHHGAHRLIALVLHIWIDGRHSTADGGARMQAA